MKTQNIFAARLRASPVRSQRPHICLTVQFCVFIPLLKDYGFANLYKDILCVTHYFLCPA